MNLLHLLTAIAVLPAFIFAQDSAESDTFTCTFSCPEENLVSWPLVKRAHTIGFNSYYSIFECVYAIPAAGIQRSEHKCSYNKGSGNQALGAVGDHCPSRAVPCPSPEVGGEGTTPPRFSNLEKEEVIPWVEGGRYLLYLQEHHSG